MSDMFFSLTPERTLDAVERASGRRATGNLQALNSVENRVYQVEMEDETWLVAKFYRPNRWTEEQIREEHAFVRELAEAEVPVIAPLALERTDDGIYIALFPRIRARLRDELDDSQVRQIGRYLARIHAVGERLTRQGKIAHRLALTPETYGRAPLEFLLASPFLDDTMKPRYQSVAQSLIDQISPMLNGVRSHCIHGDCHVGNILWDPQGPFFLDFDDVVVGPPVQDVWMVIRGRDEVAMRQREELLAGYEEMREFDRSTLRLIEPLRALRLIHYAAWIARRWEDPSFPRMFPLFGTQKYWYEEIEALENTRAAMEQTTWY